MAEKYTNIPPEREIAFMQNAAEAARDAADPIITELGNAGIKLVLSEPVSQDEAISAGLRLHVNDFREEAMQGGRVNSDNGLSFEQIQDLMKDPAPSSVPENYTPIAPEQEIKYLENAAEAANEAAIPVKAALGNVGINELMPSRYIHGQAMHQAENDLTIQDARRVTGFNQVRQEYTGSIPSTSPDMDTTRQLLQDFRSSSQQVGRIDLGPPSTPPPIG